ncbi:MAG: hypothetical protein VKM98_02320 [Cyanobacteriota bacterium]|nr:hypothetical protein [Cyanobacteriota bacterium]
MAKGSGSSGGLAPLCCTALSDRHRQALTADNQPSQGLLTVFNNKGSFFLDLGSEGAKPARVAIAPEQPAAKAETKSKAAAAPAATSAAPTATTGNAAPNLTTAEAIAAELRASQEAKPAVSAVTFAPECLNPANAVPTRRRRAGANLAGFKDMASGMFRSSN